MRNLPVDIARSMGADIIIAVNLGTPLLRPDEITSVFSVSLQMINILTEQNVNRSLKELTPRDILIVPELGNFSSGDFDNLAKTVPIGEAAARKVADRLRALSLPPEQYAALRQAAGRAGGDREGQHRCRGDQGGRHEARVTGRSCCSRCRRRSESRSSETRSTSTCAASSAAATSRR